MSFETLADNLTIYGPDRESRTCQCPLLEGATFLKGTGMIHLSLQSDITDAQMLDVVAVVEKGLPLDEDGLINLELDAMMLSTYAGDNSKVGYVQALARLVNSGLYLKGKSHEIEM